MNKELWKRRKLALTRSRRLTRPCYTARSIHKAELLWPHCEIAVGIVRKKPLLEVHVRASKSATAQSR